MKSHHLNWKVALKAHRDLQPSPGLEGQTVPSVHKMIVLELI